MVNHPNRSRRARDLAEALAPFAAFYEALRHMGGPSPKTGIYTCVESHIGGRRELTVEDFELAWKLLNPEKPST